MRAIGSKPRQPDIGLDRQILRAQARVDAERAQLASLANSRSALRKVLRR